RISRLVLLTEGARAPSGLVRRPWHHLALGLVRTLANEHPQIVVRAIDVEAVDAAADEIAREVVCVSEEDELCLTAEGRFAPRLVRHAVPDAVEIPAADNWCVRAEKKGELDALTIVATERPSSIPADQLEIRVEAVGVNFRDVLNAMGMYP